MDQEVNLLHPSSPAFNACNLCAAPVASPTTITTHFPCPVPLTRNKRAIRSAPSLRKPAVRARGATTRLPGVGEVGDAAPAVDAGVGAGVAVGAAPLALVPPLEPSSGLLLCPSVLMLCHVTHAPCLSFGLNCPSCHRIIKGAWINVL